MFRDHLLLRLLIVGRKGNTCFAFRRPALLVEKPREKPRAGCMARGGGGRVTAVGTGLPVGVMKCPKVDGGDGCAAQNRVKSTGLYTLNV